MNWKERAKLNSISAKLKYLMVELEGGNKK
jgi:hypothetical protein